MVGEKLSDLNYSTQAPYKECNSVALWFDFNTLWSWFQQLSGSLLQFAWEVSEQKENLFLIPKV